MIGPNETWEPVVGDPLVGWRTWRSVRDREGVWRLRSLYHAALWPEQEPLEAQCMSPYPNTLPAHECPSPPGLVAAHPVWAGFWNGGHECGVFASKTREAASVYRCFTPDEAGLVGAVNLWGRVAVHVNGYRAQYAYPVLLIVTRAPDGVDPEDVADSVHDVYGCDTATI